MTVYRTASWVASVVCIQMFAASVAFGQAEPEQPEPSELTSGENLSLVDEDIGALSGQQKLERGAKKIKKMQKMLASVTSLLEDVRQNEKDILKVNCINEKQAAIKGFLKVSQQSYTDLKAAVEDKDTESAKHHYTLVSVADQKVRGLTEAARLCTGEERRYSGQAQVDVTEPDVGVDGVDVPDRGFDPVAELPELSPYQ